MPRKLVGFLVLYVLAAVSVAYAATAVHRSPAADAPPAEMARTVDAFLGSWTLDGTVMIADIVPVKATLSFDCKKTALGKAVACTMSGNAPELGSMEASYIIGYDTWGKRVRVLSISSDEEVHDHACTWKGESLVCDPLAAGMRGQAVTEELSFAVSGARMSLKSVNVLADGFKIVFEASATKR